MSTVIRLTTPIEAHGQTISEIELREPTAKDVIEIGYPYLVHSDGVGDGSVELRANIAAKYIQRLGAIPRSSVERMSPSDLQMAQVQIMDFFGVSPEPTETPED